MNSDTFVSPIDALLVINDLNAIGARPLVDPPTGPPFIDVNGDGFLSPLDALLVINYLNRGGAGEGESATGTREVVPGPEGTKGNRRSPVAGGAPAATLPAGTTAPGR